MGGDCDEFSFLRSELCFLIITRRRTVTAELKQLVLFLAEAEKITRNREKLGSQEEEDTGESDCDQYA